MFKNTNYKSQGDWENTNNSYVSDKFTLLNFFTSSLKCNFKYK